MTKAHLEVVRIVSRRDFDGAASEAHFDVVVRNDRDFPSVHRQNENFAHEMLVFRIFRVDRNGGVARNGFRPGGGHFDVAASVLQRVSEMPQKAVFFGIFDLCVRKSRAAGRAPVDDSVAAIDKPLVVKLAENLQNRRRQIFVHSERFPRPVAAGAESFELLDYSAAVLFFPFPRAAQKFFSSDFPFVKAFGFQFINDFDFGCDRSVVRARDPQSLVARHTFETNDNILHGFVQSVPHVQLPRDVWRRHNDGKRLLLRIRFCAEIAAFRPEFIQFFLKKLWLISFFHSGSPI